MSVVTDISDALLSLQSALLKNDFSGEFTVMLPTVVEVARLVDAVETELTDRQLRAGGIRVKRGQVVIGGHVIRSGS